NLLNDPRPNKEEEEQEGQTEEEETAGGEIIKEPARKEVKVIISKSKNNKASGKDGINMKFLKYGGKEL
ncbi:hypothetical protein ILUMI_10942, partial [Ignelater luminosus]